MPFYWLTLGILAAWRIAHFLHAEDGPFDVSVRLRKLAGSGMIGRAFDCFYCLSVWVGAPISAGIGQSAKEMLFLWPAISAGACLLERVTHGKPAPPPVLYVEGENNDELLRQTSRTMAR